jgi:hypothetical protein
MKPVHRRRRPGRAGEPERGFEPLAYRLQVGCATTAPLGRRRTAKQRTARAKVRAPAHSEYVPCYAKSTLFARVANVFRPSSASARRACNRGSGSSHSCRPGSTTRRSGSGSGDTIGRQTARQSRQRRWYPQPDRQARSGLWVVMHVPSTSQAYRHRRRPPTATATGREPQRRRGRKGVQRFQEDSAFLCVLCVFAVRIRRWTCTIL